MRVVVLASGNGSNAEALMRAARADDLGFQVSAVVTDQAQAGVMTKAKQHDVAVAVLEKHAGEQRATYDTRLSEVVNGFQPDLVVLAGWMRILTDSFISTCGAPIINLHPALPGEFPGVGAIERAYEGRDSGRTSSGIMVHLVPDEGVDTGPVLGTVEVPLGMNDSLETFTHRIHDAEHELLVRIVTGVATGLISIQQGAPQ